MKQKQERIATGAVVAAEYIFDKKDIYNERSMAYKIKQMKQMNKNT